MYGERLLIYSSDEELSNFGSGISIDINFAGKKNNRVPGKDYLIRIEDRNKKIQLLNNTVIQTDFAGYSDDLIGRMWSYAKLSGIKEYRG